MKRSLTLAFALIINIFALSAQQPLEPLVDFPQLTQGEAAAGRVVSVCEPEYEGTSVHHLVYLPTNYDASKPTPMIVEYTGNKWNYGDGSVEEALLGYSITLGRDFIWVVLPYVSEDGTHNQDLWWGDADATAAYARMVIPRIAERYNGDLSRVTLCGFSRGAIGASYIGLHDDQTAKLWNLFITHDHFDGQKEWRGKVWGSPLADYRAAAAERLKRLDGREWLVSSKNPSSEYQSVIDEMGADKHGRFSYLHVPISTYFPEIPNKYLKHPHTDRWALFDIDESRVLREWLMTRTKIK